MARPYSAQDSLRSIGRVGQANWSAALARRVRGFEANQISDTYHREARERGLNPDLALAQACEECAWFTDHLWTERSNPCGLGITRRGELGKDYGDPVTGVRAHLDHLCCYAYSAATCPVEHEATPDPRHTFHDGNPALAHLQEPRPGRRWAEKDGYVGRILAIVNALPQQEEAPMATPREVTDRCIAALRARGVDVTDLRGRLPVNPNPAHRYGLVAGGPGGVRYLIQHWTGDAFSRATLRQITGTDYGQDRIAEGMSRDDELDLLRWYANFHISRDGGTWGGIAYGTMVFPSGRVYINWDLGTLTYHAFSVNGYSYALCTPAANGQAPTTPQLVALNHVWEVLTKETPAVPADASKLLGHTEAKALDGQNQTSCPGPALLGHVRRYRATGAPTVSLAPVGTDGTVEAQARPAAPNPAAREFAETGKWVIEPLLSYWRDNGGLPALGLPVSGMYRDEGSGLLVQYFERARLEVQPDGTITRGRIGAELAALLKVA